jgi:hypothetical protein
MDTRESSFQVMTRGLAREEALPVLKADAELTQTLAGRALSQAEVAISAASQVAVDAAADATAKAAAAQAAAALDAQARANAASTAAIAAAAADATAKAGAVNATLTRLASDLNNDDVLTPVEKLATRLLCDALAVEQSGLSAQAAAFSITAERTAYNAAITALASFITTNGCWTDMGANTAFATGGGATFRTNIQTALTTKQTLLTKIATQAKALAEQTAFLDAGNQALAAQEAAIAAAALDATAKSGAVQGNLDTLNTSLNSDDILTPVEKSSTRPICDALLAEKSGLVAQATAYSIVAERDSYDAAVTVLASFITTNGCWTSMTSYTALAVGGGSTFRTNIQYALTTKQALLTKLAMQAKVLAEATAASDATYKAGLVQGQLTTLTNALNSDDIITPPEKQAIRPMCDALASEQSTLDAQATSFGIVAGWAARNNYDAAVATLGAYVSTWGLWTSMTAQTDLQSGGGALLRGYIQSALTTKQALLNVIAAQARALAEATAAGDATTKANAANNAAQAAAMLKSAWLANVNDTTISGAKITTGTLDANAINGNGIATTTYTEDATTHAPTAGVKMLTPAAVLGIADWAASTNYAQYAIVKVSGTSRMYIKTNAGTHASGTAAPTTYGTDIADGSVVWMSYSPLRVGPGGITIKGFLLDESTAVATRMLDRTNMAADIGWYKGNCNTSPTYLSGAPNISRLFIQGVNNFTTHGSFSINLFLRPSALSDNLDGMRYAKLDLYRGNATAATFIQTSYVPLSDRLYANTTTHTATSNISAASFFWQNDVVSGIISTNDPRWFLFVTIYNAYGPSASAWFVPPSGLGADWTQQSTAPYTGGGSGGGGGGGGGGGRGYYTP